MNPSKLVFAMFVISASTIAVHILLERGAAQALAYGLALFIALALARSAVEVASRIG